MGLLDKIGSAAKDAKEKAGNVMQSAKETASSANAGSVMQSAKGAMASVKEKAATAKEMATAFKEGMTSDDSQTEKYQVSLIDLHTTIPSGEENECSVQPIVGESREFELSGIQFTVPKGLDAHNQYLKAFAPLQKSAYESFSSACLEKIDDALSYFEVFPNEYDENLYPLLKTAMGYLVASNIWGVSYAQFAGDFKQHASSIADGWEVITQHVQELIENDPELLGARLAASSLEMFGAHMIDSADSRIVESAQKAVWANIAANNEEFVEGYRQSAGLTEEQLEEVYELVQGLQDQFLSYVQQDYENVVNLLILYLRQNGADVWWPDEDKQAKANTIFMNLQSADLSQPNAVKALIEVLLADPYNETIYVFMDEKIEDKSQVQALRGYFIG